MANYKYMTCIRSFDPPLYRIAGEKITISIQLPPVTASHLEFAKTVCEIVKQLVTVLSPIFSVELIVVDVQSNRPITKCQANIDRAYGTAPGLLINSADPVVASAA
ncbi:hypothetical protein IMCC3135_16770 [Granulosicoccus antarcticus IMCC3135]|uniref:Uncharacterized protein n=1 Tax=Granulosicoccus antarcticus IMCC3135 TaxID=1192854 RepID=A0A2Z2NPR0_9GAMM|nr:hypothetical protein IMCC3135_16770 [Granulosicoccus antarcticus IMCC3135]